MATPQRSNVSQQASRGAHFAGAQTTRVQGPRSYRQSSPRTPSGPPIKIIAFALALIAVVIACFVIHGCVSAKHNGASAVATGKEVTVSIAEGSGAQAVAKSLLDAGVITSSEDFLKELTLKKADSNLKPGTYSFTTGMSVEAVVQQLVKGPNTTANKLSIPEGLTLKKTAALVEKSLGIKADDFLAQAKASSYVNEFPFLQGVADDSLEGFMCPKTYDFSGKEISADSVIRALLNQYKAEHGSLDFESARANIQSTYGITMSDYQILTLASIIEREAVTQDDRPLVSSVFYNRLKQGMALQSDATMGYVLDREVTADDLKTQSPYNTYLNKGLTPTPICTPSIASLKAAMEPAKTDYLYFFIVENGNYSNHSFSKTYEEHQQVIEAAKKAQS
ncbi:MAG: endolytic transglycosylase MltG [Atopobium sp.]|uniref:endolytic transglycosylase MltG n=1 Tax=Atopobium sp. TaxID=1872650 RepID=UPI002A75B52D|nr:endolytic transglycosylase MltG [Atopobium sp.]MDY2788143.1 endolytic transglycosylase MltG [Atopobium sp.]